MTLPKAVFLMGPTAAGKTQFAIDLHQALPVDIISVDSALVYRGMDIGTAKPDARTLARAPHALIDIRDPEQAYSAAEFRKDALKLMQASAEAGRFPLLVGGTMLYFNALSFGLSDLPAADAGVRAKLESEARQKGWSAMHQELSQLDPEAGARIHPNDPQRIQRALEVIRITGKPMSELQRVDGEQVLDYEVMRIIACPEPRARLHERIERRFDVMMEQGFMGEMQGLFDSGRLDASMPSMRCVGYRQAWEYLEGETSAEEMRLKAIFATRQLAKRQITWLRRESQALWYDPSRASAQEAMFTEVSKFLEK